MKLIMIYHFRAALGKQRVIYHRNLMIILNKLVYNHVLVKEVNHVLVKEATGAFAMYGRGRPHALHAHIHWRSYFPFRW